MPNNPNPKVFNRKHLARLERERIQNRYIVSVAIFVLVIVLGTIIYGILDQTVLQARQPVARVGNETITSQEFQTQVKYVRQQMIQQYDQTKQLMSFFGSDPQNASYFQSSLQQIRSQLDDPSVMGRQVLDRMIQDRLIRQEAVKRGITVSNEEIDKAMQEAFGYFPDGTPTPSVTPTVINTPSLSATQLALVTITPTPTQEPTATESATPTSEPPTATPTGPAVTPSVTPTEAPLPTSTPYTLEGYQKSVSTFVDSMKPYGFTQADLRGIITAQLYRDKVRADITKDLKPESEEVWARHILVPDEAAGKAVQERLNNGEDWAKIASEASTDTSNKDKGGDLGWFARGAMVKEFEDSAFSLKVGETSQPVKTSFGFHIIQVLGHEMRPLNGTAFDTFKDTKFQEWLDEAKKNANIQEFDRWKDRTPAEPILPADEFSQGTAP